MSVKCSPSGTTLACTARQDTFELYCSGPSGDVTNTVDWIATNPAVGRFAAPGRFEFTSPGTTVIYAQDWRLLSGSAYAYTLGFDGELVEAIPIDVIVEGDDGGSIEGATVQLTSVTGETHTCTSGSAPRFTPCRMWVDAVPDEHFTTVVVVASKAGYTTASKTLTVERLQCPTCSPNAVALRLSRPKP
jgi:hypothetical protein